MMRLALVVLLATTAAGHAQLAAVPAPVKTVAIDGQLDDWDVSAPMVVHPDQKPRDRYAVRVHAMWDAQNLYLGLVWRDPTPLFTLIDDDAIHDGFRCRFRTDREVRLTSWHAPPRRKTFAQFESENDRRSFKSDGLELKDAASNFKQCFRVDADSRGYVQEMRIPWPLLMRKPDVAAGKSFTLKGEFLWGDPWPLSATGDAGRVELLAKGKLPAKIDAEARLQGPIVVRVEVPREATKFTLAIDDAAGRRVRNLVDHADVSDYVIPSRDGKRIVQVPWDGRSEAGEVVAEGTYTARGLTHSGVGVRFAGGFGNPGVPPWESKNAKPTTEATDSRGWRYVADATAVKMFDDKGKLVRTIGEPGGHKPGPWNPQRMNKPVGIAVEELDGKRSIWVLESPTSRIGVWGEDGKLRREFIGGTRSGGVLSDDLPSLGIVDGLMLEVEPERFRDRPVEWMGLPSNGAMFGDGHHFLGDASGSAVEYYVEGANLAVRRGDRWRWAVAFGSADAKLPEGFPKRPNANAVFLWNDLNADGAKQPDEVKWFDPGRPDVLRRTGAGYRCGRDLVFHHSGFAFAPARFDADGAPIYDVASVVRLPADLGAFVGDLHKTRFGWVGTGDAETVGFAGDGRRRWAVPLGQHRVHKLTGMVSEEDRNVIAFRGVFGQEFLIRDDGLYVGELFTDQRDAPASLPADRDVAKLLGMPINDTTLGRGPPSGWLARQRDGKTRVTYGATEVRVAEVVGLDTIKELPPTALNVGAEQIAAAKRSTPRKRND